MTERIRRGHDAPSERTRVRRLGERGAYDAATVHAILDAGLRRQDAPLRAIEMLDVVEVHYGQAMARLLVSAPGIETIDVPLRAGQSVARQGPVGRLMSGVQHWLFGAIDQAIQ